MRSRPHVHKGTEPGDPANPPQLTYVITVSRRHLQPAQMCIEGLLLRTSAPVLVVGNLEPDEAGLIRSLGVGYVDERDIDVSGRLPAFSWDEKYREAGWYRQMFFRLCVDRYVDTEQAVILDSEVFVFSNWDESRFYDPATHFPRCFYWVPAVRKPDWDYRMYRGAAYLLQPLPGFEDVLHYANSDGYQRHISGVVLFSTANVRELWRRLESETDLAHNLDQLFNHEPDLAFSDHDLYGIACERGLFEDTVPTLMHDNLLGWYDNHDDPHFERFREGAMWSMCQHYWEYPTPEAYREFMQKTARTLGMTLPGVLWTGGRLPPPTPHEVSGRLADPRFGEGDGDDRIAVLTRALPEIYQPIYGHPDIVASRSGDDHRIDVLCRAVRRVSSHLSRPLRILDLGSSQGYIALHLAQLGHHVTGIDSVPENVALARALSEEHPELDVAFVDGDVVDCRDLVELGGFDLVIGFSVLHHVAHRDGHASAVELMSTLSRLIPHALFEMALTTEPVYWAESLPSDPRVTLAPYPFIREIGLVGNHLSDVQRPILYASTACVLARDQLHDIASWIPASHDALEGAPRGLRRYYFVESGIVKVTARFVDNPNEPVFALLQQEFRREARMLGALAGSGIEAPDVLEFVDGPHESVLFRTSFPGVLLSEIIHAIDDDVKATITGQVLESLGELEAHGLYHTDLRTWNVVWDADAGKAHLIDHGALSPLPEDVVWPNDAYFSLLVWLVSVWGSYPDPTGTRFPRLTGIDRAEFSPRVASLFSALMVHPRDDRVLRDLAADWASSAGAENPALWPTAPVAWSWLAALERRAEEQGTSLSAERQAAEAGRVAAEAARLAAEAARVAAEAARDATAADRDRMASELHRVVSEYHALAADRDELHALSDALRAEQSAAQRRTEAAQAQVARMLHSRTWRLTRPLRRLGSAVRRSLGSPR